MNAYQQNIIDTLKKEQYYKTTPKELFNSFGFERRTKLNCRTVDNFLSENELSLTPHYSSVWFGAEISIIPKAKARRRSNADPIKRLCLLSTANRAPVYVANNTPLSQATTLMMIHHYSRIPVTQNGLRGTIGYLSWRSIGEARANGVTSDCVKDYIDKDVVILNKETPLLEAIHKVYKKGFILVENEKKELCGIVTTQDISTQFLIWTKPFLILEEIENQVRSLIDGKLLLEGVKRVCQEENRIVEHLDDLTFGEYLRILQDETLWEKLGLNNIDRTIFTKELDKVREIRNDIMHFDPDGLTRDQIQTLENMAEYLRKIAVQFTEDEKV